VAPKPFLHPFARPARADFLTIVRGKGAFVFDDSGKCYVDAMASLWYMNVGHGRAEMIDAITAQMRKLASYHTYEPFTNEPAEELAARIAEIAPMERPRVFFTSSGSEAVDAAIKLARSAQIRARHPERVLVVAREHAYHGTTYGGTSAQGLPANQQGFGPLVPGFVHIPSNDLAAAEMTFARHRGEIAAVMAEPVQGAGGVHPPAPGFLEGLRRLCDEHGAYLILDEVICGFGRLGSWFGAERFGIRPDLVTFAKGVSSGYLPLGGVIISRGICEVLEADESFVLRHGHTYSGHPTTCAAGLAALAITRREGLLERALRVGKRLEDSLRSLVRDGLLAEVRGDGGLWAAGLLPGQDSVAVRDAMLRGGVIVRAVNATTVAFCPPLVIGDAEIDRCVQTLRDVLN
jgi:adenosylmethionine-8-amino-7-oxononanoate aminotransferase